MATIQKYSNKMIEKYLKSKDLKYMVDSDGDYRLDFSYDDDWGAELSVLLGSIGEKKDVYRITIQSTKRIPKSDWGRCMFICNTWNKDKLWPKAYLYVKDFENDSTGSIILEEYLDMEKDIHQEFLDYFTNVILSQAMQFWKWAHKEQGL